MTKGNASSPLRILVLADTHNHLPANICALALNTAEIWHLGDVCRESVLHELKKVGPPVTIVRGNCDHELRWPITVDLTRHGQRFRLQHIAPRLPPPDCDVFLHGHTHVPRDEIVAGVRFLNPGCVTRPNRGAPASVGFLEISPAGALAWELTRLR